MRENTTMESSRPFFAREGKQKTTPYLPKERSLCGVYADQAERPLTVRGGTGKGKI